MCNFEHHLPSLQFDLILMYLVKLLLPVFMYKAVLSWFNHVTIVDHIWIGRIFLNPSIISLTAAPPQEHF